MRDVNKRLSWVFLASVTLSWGCDPDLLDAQPREAGPSEQQEVSDELAAAEHAVPAQPDWVKRRNAVKKINKDAEALVDSDDFMMAFDRIETDPEAAAEAKSDPMGYLKKHNVPIPEGLVVEELSHSSPGYVRFQGCFWDVCVRFSVAW